MSTVDVMEVLGNMITALEEEGLERDSDYEARNAVAELISAARYARHFIEDSKGGHVALRDLQAALARCGGAS